MELYVAEYAYYVVELWQEFVTRLIKLLLNRNLEENVRTQSLLKLRHLDSLIVIMIFFPLDSSVEKWFTASMIMYW